MYEKLVTLGKIGNVTVKNCLVMSPMGIGLAELDGSPSEDMLAFYEAQAMGGAGLIILEITRVNDVRGTGLMRQLSVTQDRHIPSLARLATVVHKHGAKIFIQLHHPGRETVTAFTGGQPVVSASPISCKYLQQKPRALTTEEVQQLIAQFVAGAAQGQKAGCDGVELHAAHGYLLQQFLSSYTNKREDQYGGSIENHLRILTEIVAGIGETCGPDFPIGVRLSVEEFLDKTGVTEDYIHIQDGMKIAMALEGVGIDFIDVSVGLYETGITCVEPISYPQGQWWELSRLSKIMCIFPSLASPPFGGPGNFISMGRSWPADEQWGKKVQEGREAELRKCINCLRRFKSLNQWNAAGLPPECALNPRMARERKYGDLKRDIQEAQSWSWAAVPQV